MADVAILSSVHHPDDGRLVRWRAALEDVGLSVELVGRTVRRSGWRAAARRAVDDVLLPLRHPARVVLVPDPDLALTALPVRPLRGAAVVADVHEEYVRIADDRAWATGALRWVAKAGALVAVRAAARADATIVADGHYPPVRARRRVVVENIPGRHELGSAGSPSGTRRAIYIGDVRRSRGLVTMVDAVLDAPSWELDIVGPISAVDREWVASRTDGAPDRVRVHGRLAPPEAWAVAQGAACGLCLLDPTPAFLRQMPTKVYEYLAVGLPVLATPLPRLVPMLGGTDAAVLVADASAAAAALRAWIDPAALQRSRAAAIAWADANLPARSPFADGADVIKELVEARRAPRHAAGPRPRPPWPRRRRAR